MKLTSSFDTSKIEPMVYKIEFLEAEDIKAPELVVLAGVAGKRA